MTAVARETVASPVRVALPGGLWRDGEGAVMPVRELDLCAVGDTGLGSVLDSLDAGLLPSVRATSLLQSCLAGATADTAQALSVGDREALLLHLRRLVFGDSMECVLDCPAVACGKPMELALRVSDLLLPAYADPAPEHALQLEHAGARYELRFRLPTAADLAAAAALVCDDADSAGLALLQRCVAGVTCNGRPLEARALPVAVRDAAAAAMAERDPQAEIELHLACPACGHTFSVVFDTASFLLQELDARAAQVLREVHVLAAHYGWGEREILQMPARRRARYIGLIAEAQARASAG